MVRIIRPNKIVNTSYWKYSEKAESVKKKEINPEMGNQYFYSFLSQRNTEMLGLLRVASYEM